MPERRIPSDIPVLPHRIFCGCEATAKPDGWHIEAEAFLCEYRHKQGDVVHYPTHEEVAEEQADAASY